MPPGAVLAATAHDASRSHCRGWGGIPLDHRGELARSPAAAAAALEDDPRYSGRVVASARAASAAGIGGIPISIRSLSEPTWAGLPVLTTALEPLPTLPPEPMADAMADARHCDGSATAGGTGRAAGGAATGDTVRDTCLSNNSAKAGAEGGAAGEAIDEDEEHHRDEVHEAVAEAVADSAPSSAWAPSLAVGKWGHPSTS